MNINFVLCDTSLTCLSRRYYSFFSHLDIKPHVSFSLDEMFDVKVTHWQTLESKKIAVTACLNVFLVRVRTSFSEEITTQRFRLYQLPHNSNDINQKTLISTDQSYNDCLKRFKDAQSFPPLLYVWNDDTSPEKLPEKKEEFDRSDTRTNSSRDSSSPRKAKERDNEKCLVCSMKGLSNLEACHIFERKHYNRLTVPLKTSILNLLALNSIDEIQNLITMCKQCHGKFDSHLLGIDPETMSLIVTEVVRDEMSNPFSKVAYQNLHGNCITQSEYPHKRFSEKAVKYRFETYFSTTEKNKDKHYCPKCAHVSKSKQEFGQHFEASKCCRVTKEVSYDSNEQIDIVAKLSLLTIDESDAYERFKETFVIKGKNLNSCSSKDLISFLRSKNLPFRGND